MARQAGMRASGSISNLIFYERDGKGYIRLKPAKVKQTKATKTRGKQFGLANKIEKTLRLSLQKLIPDTKDRPMMRRMVQCLYQWLMKDPFAAVQQYAPVSQLEGFNYNEKCLLHHVFKPPLTVSADANKIYTLQLPAFDPSKTITAPAGTLKVNMLVAAFSLAVSREMITAYYFTETAFDYSNKIIPAQNIPLNIQPAAANLFIAAVALQFTVPDKKKLIPCTDMRHLPAAIISAVY
jgi:hypothetical protein